LQKLPSKLDPKLFPGARTRYDDFVGVHINQTLTIHLTVRFLISSKLFIPLFYIANDSADTRRATF
jgi:tyrosinase